MEIVNLRVFRGKVNYDANGNVTSENQTCKIARPSKEWGLFLKNAPIMYTRVDIIDVKSQEIKPITKVVNGKEVHSQEHIFTKVEVSEEIKSDVAGIFEKKVQLTSEQKQIAELQKMVQDLVGDKSTKVVDKNKSKIEEKTVVAESDSNIEELREQYFKLFDKKPSHLMKAEKLKSEINAKLNS